MMKYLQTLDITRRKVFSRCRYCLNIGARYLFTSKLDMAKRLFEEEDHAKLYATYRPTYPNGLYEHIFKYYEDGLNTMSGELYELAVDVGCGSGQSSKPLCGRFKQVIGYDVSEKQVQSAAAAMSTFNNISFKVGPGEDLSFLKDRSVDLVTIAQALHWLDLDKFYPEVERVLKPGGVFAAYGYGNNIVDDDQANSEIKQFYSGLLGPYWDVQRGHIDTKYSNISIPLRCHKRVEDKSVSIVRSWSIDAYIGYLSTWSAWQTYIKRHPGSSALLELKEKLQERYGSKDVQITWPGFLLLGRK